ncbi:ATP-binding protein [Nanoarchaeota archaeon]
MTKRKIIKIDQEKCNGCGKCIPNCPEGALQLIDGKARLVSDLFCDGLGACIGHCPEGAINIEEREAEPYDEAKVMVNIVKQGKNTIKAHLKHLKDHGAKKYYNQAVEFLKEKGIENPLGTEKPKLPCGCPGSMVREVKKNPKKGAKSVEQESELRQWPVQLKLLPLQAPFFKNSDLLIAADCVGFANPNLHNELIKGKAIAIGCPKFDDIQSYKERIKDIIKSNNIKSVTVAIMEVPCCYGMYVAVEEALKESGKKIPLTKKVISISGEIKE